MPKSSSPLAPLTLEGRKIIITMQDLGRFHDGYPVAGDHKSGIIRLSPGATKQDMRLTVLHEIIHECCRVSGIKGKDIPLRDEEFILTKITPWLLQLLQENPHLVSFLTDQ